MIPRFGYRLEDMRDDDVLAENPSAEGSVARAVAAKGAFADLRESAAVYFGKY